MIILPSMKGIISKPIISYIEGMLVATTDPNILYKFDTSGAIVPTFTSGFVTSNVNDNYVFYFNSLLVLPNKKIIAAGIGNSSYFGDGYYGYRSLERLNSDGSLDLSFNAGFLGPRDVGAGSVSDVAIDSNNNIIGVGLFTSYDSSYDGSPAPGIFRLNSTGAFDNSFSPSIDFYGSYCVTVQSDDKILIGGSANTLNYGGICRLNSDGSEDTSFSANRGSGFNGDVFDIAVLSNGKIVCVGFFQYYNGVATPNGIAMLNSDGTLYETFNTNAGTGFDDAPTGITIETGIDGSYETLLIHGPFFTSYNGHSAGRLIRIYTSPSYAGLYDITFHTETGFDSIVSSVDLQSDGQIVCAGQFTTYNGVACSSVARLQNPTYIQLDTSYNPNIGLLIPYIVKKH